jgi:hypothetical protein
VADLAAATEADPAQRRNAFRTALELAVSRLPADECRPLLRGWAEAVTDEGLRHALGRQLVRLVLLGQADLSGSAPDLDTAASLLPGDPLPALARSLLAPGEPVRPSEHPAGRLWRAAGELAAGPVEERWRQEVRDLRGQARWRGLAQALLVQEAAGRGDAAGVAALLEEVDAWRAFRNGPPQFVRRAVEAVVAGQPAHPAWQRSLPRWLQVWGPAVLGPAGATLAALAGLADVPAEAVEAPAGTPAVPWFLHQSARALGRGDAAGALALVRRGLALDPDLAGVSAAETVRAALPELERRAAAQHLAACLGAPGRPAPEAGLFADLVDLLRGCEEGLAVLVAAGRGEAEAVWAALAELGERPDLPPRLAHHLAVDAGRTALALEGTGRTELAELAWRRAWGCWLRLLAGGSPAPALVVDHLLGLHRQRINDLLARGAVDEARRHGELVQELPARAARLDEGLGRDLAERVARFREELATAYLLTTREAMRYGAIPEGWRADYDKGLGYLRRLLSLDRDNLRLLTALVEVCAEWFLDLYNAGDAPGLHTQVERYTPFALHLARLAQDRPGELPARAALADFYKFRGFLAPDRAAKVALYREALRFDPANANVRHLLAELDEGLSQ